MQKVPDSENWHSCNEIDALGWILLGLSNNRHNVVTARKVALCEVACARRVAHLMTHDIQRQTIDLGEIAADDKASVYPLPIYAQIGPYFDEHGPAPDFLPLPPKDPIENASFEIAANIAYPDPPGTRAKDVGGRCDILMTLASDSSSIRPENAAQVLIVKDIFGNPFRPIVADRGWLTPNVQSIAAAIYRDRAFDRLPILADALEEAGCTNADVLLHCRQPAVHVRGCWVVDLVLGKE